MRFAARRGKPVVIADVEDNAGGGGSSDTTGLLRALIDAGADNAILALMNDPAAAAMAHAAGIGGIFETGLGGRSGCTDDAPLHARFEVTALSDGTVPFEGEVYHGGTAQIGPTACLRVLDTPGVIRVVVGSVRNQCLDRAYFRHIGLTPETARIVCVKSTVHFRADFDPIAQATILAASVPGALASDLTTVPFRNLRPGVRLGPGGPPMAPKKRSAPVVEPEETQ
jgi:microcystin degradation protein MlrC